MDKAVPIIVNAIVQNAGQTCAAGSRLLVQQDIQDVFLARIADHFNETRVGTPEMDLSCGPIINRKQYERVSRFISQSNPAFRCWRKAAWHPTYRLKG